MVLIQREFRQLPWMVRMWQPLHQLPRQLRQLPCQLPEQMGYSDRSIPPYLSIRGLVRTLVPCCMHLHGSGLIQIVQVKDCVIGQVALMCRRIASSRAT